MIAPVPQSRLILLNHALMPERAALWAALRLLLVSYTASSGNFQVSEMVSHFFSRS